MRNFSPSALRLYCFGLMVLAGLWAGPAQAQLAASVLNPARNARSVARTANVTLSYTQTIDATTMGRMRVFGTQTGRKAGATNAASSTTITFNPTLDFRPGEEVNVTVPSTILTTNFVQVTPLVYQFRAAAGTGPGTFAASSFLSVQGRCTAFTLGDVDADGDLDVVSSDGASPSQNSVCFNNGTGTFSNTLGVVSLGAFPTKLKLADVDGDNDLDLVAAVAATGGGVGFLEVRFNNGTGSFGGASSLQLGGLPSDLVVGDFDADGDLDAATVSSNTNKVSIRVNNGNGVFSGTQEVTVGTSPRQILLGDLNADGDLDLVVRNNTDNTVSVLTNNGTGTFTVGATISIATLRSIALFDFDNDSDLDLLSCDGTASQVGIRTNNGSGTFAAAASGISVGFAPNTVTMGDVDGDADLDLVVTGNQSTGIRLNNGAGVFSGTHNVGRTTTLDLFDIDGDLDLDMFSPNVGTTGGLGSLTLVRNKTAPTIISFTPTTGPVGTTVTITGTNFTGATGVQFLGPSSLAAVNATFTVVNATTITCTVPAGAQTGPLAVTTPDGTAVSSQIFTVVPVPVILSFDPTSGPVGTVVTITGSNLDVATAVQFNGTPATFTVVSPTTIVATVPPGATTGPISIVAPGGTATSTTNFVVTTVTTPVTLAVDSVTAKPGASVTVPIRTRDFTTLVGLQGTLQFDPALLTLVSASASSVLTGSAQVLVTPAGTVRVFWTAAANTALSLPADQVIFTLQLTVSPSAAAGVRLPINWASSPVPVEATRATLLPAPVSAFNGGVRIDPGAKLTGTVRTGNNTPIPGVSLTLTGSSTPPAQVTPSNGTFTLTSGVAGLSYTLTPSKVNDVTVTNGVTVTDLVLIQRHVLASQLLGVAYKVVSADVNNDRAVTSTDAALVQDFILGNTTAFTGGALWRFFMSTQSFPNPNSPGTLLSSRSYTVLAASANQSFVGCKLGDVNDSWNPAIPRPATVAPAIGLALGSAQVAPGQRVQVPVALATAATLTGLQGTVQWDASAFRLVGISTTQVGVRFGSPAPGTLTLLWTDPTGQPQPLAAGTTLGWLELEAIGSPGTTSALSLTSALTTALATDGALDTHDLTAAPGQLTIGQVLGNSSSLIPHSSFTLAPNPAHEAVRLSGAAAHGAVQLHDALGREVRRTLADATGGATLSVAGLPAGVYWVRTAGRATRLVVE